MGKSWESSGLAICYTGLGIWKELIPIPGEASRKNLEKRVPLNSETALSFAAFVCFSASRLSFIDACVTERLDALQA